MGDESNVRGKFYSKGVGFAVGKVSILGIDEVGLGPLGVFSLSV